MILMKPKRHLVLLITLLLLFMSVLPVFAQGAEPTDRPFPGQSQPAEQPTDRPFPGQSTTAATAEPTNVPDAASESAEAETTPEEEVDALTLDEAVATIAAVEQQVTALQAEVTRLTADLEASESDNGATTFALVIIGVGLILAFAVFFGLRRSGI